MLRGRNYITDSGGAGQWRGGCGSHFVKEVRTPTYVNQYVVNQTHIHPGIAGGQHGAPDEMHLSRRDREVRSSVPPDRLLLQTGEQLVYHFGGGGGWGDPLDPRPPGRPRRRVGRVRVGRGRAARLRRRPHRLARGA